MIVSSIIFSITTTKIARDYDPCGPNFYAMSSWHKVVKMRREAMERAEKARARNTALESLMYALLVVTLGVVLA